jgi:hypothetical protein
MSKNHESFAVKNPGPYKGEVTRPGTPKSAEDTCSIIEAANYYDLPPILERYGEWVICEDGIYCLWFDYYIDKSRLNEPYWISHITKKAEVSASDFKAAFNRAKEILLKK